MPEPKSTNKPPLLARLAFYYLVIFGCLVIGFGISYLQLPPYGAIDKGFKELATFFKGTPEEGKSASDRLLLHRQERRQNLFDPGFNLRDPNFVDPGYLLISEFNKEVGQVIVRLVAVDGFEEIYRWLPPIEEILNRTSRDTKNNNLAGYTAQNPVLHSDGSLVFTSGNGPLVKISKDNEIFWIVDGHFHHSIEVDHNRNYVVPVVNKPAFMQFDKPYRDDAYSVISAEGKVLDNRSVGKIMLQDDRFFGLFLGAGFFTEDRLHLNDAQPILEDNGIAKKGDIAFSMRHLSLVMLYRPSTNKIIWGRIGPWTYQHDINILPDGRYSIFSNNVLCVETIDNVISHKSHSEVYIYDATTDSVVSPYGDQMEKSQCISSTGGRSRILPNGDVFLEQYDYCRILRLSGDTLRWEYTNKVTDDTEGMVNWCRYLLPDEVDLDWLETTKN